MATGAVGLALAALLPQVWTPQAAGPLVTAISVAGLLGVAAWWTDRQKMPRIAQLALAVAALWGGVAAWSVATWAEWPAPATVGAALIGALMVTALIRTVTPVAGAQLGGLSLLGAAGAVVGVITVAGGDPLAGVRLAAVAAVLVVGVLPRVSLTIGGLASADYRVRNHGLVTSEALAARIAQSDALLYGSLLGVAVLGAATGGLLAGSELLWDRLLGVMAGAALVLRSRVFSRISQILPLRIAGLAVLAGHGVTLGQDWPPLRPWLVPAAALAARCWAAQRDPFVGRGPSPGETAAQPAGTGGGGGAGGTGGRRAGCVRVGGGTYARLTGAGPGRGCGHPVSPA